MSSTRHVQNGQYIEANGVSALIHCAGCKPFENDADCTMLPLQDPRRQGGGPRRLLKCAWCTTQGQPCSNAALDAISLGLDRPELAQTTATSAATPSTASGPPPVYQARQDRAPSAPARQERAWTQLDRRQIAQAAENRQRAQNDRRNAPNDCSNSLAVLDLQSEDEEVQDTPRSRSKRPRLSSEAPGPSGTSSTAVTVLPTGRQARQGVLQLFSIDELLENAFRRARLPIRCSDCKEVAAADR